MPLVQHTYDVLQSEMSAAGISLLRLMLAAVLGGAIGLEREFKHRPAGLRTNLFICVGAAMYTLLSDALAVKFLGDHTRIAAQIIPGIGFIGAGSILHARGSVTGLTSAATIWVVAAIGMALGSGAYVEALESLSDDPLRREELVERGRARARTFTWQRTAEQTADVYRSLL